MKPEEQVRADFERRIESDAQSAGLEASLKVADDGSYLDPSIQSAWFGYRAAYPQARREALEQALEIVCEAKENICAGGLAENRQYEESIVGPHLDGVADEIDALIKD